MKTDKKAQVVATARQVFLQHGYARTTMQDLATAAGMSRPALYLVFPSKEEIFAAVFSHSMGRKLDGLIAESRPDWPLSKKLLRVMEVMVAEHYEIIHAYPNGGDLLSLDRPLPGVAENFARVVDYVAQILREPLMASPIEASPVEIARMLMSAAQGFTAIAADGAELRRMLALSVQMISASIELGGVPASGKTRKAAKSRAPA